MEDTRFVIIRGFIDCRDEKQPALYGVFLGVASQDEVQYLKAQFSPAPIDRQLGYAALLTLLDEDGSVPAAAEDGLHQSKISLERFIARNRLLQASAKNMNNKLIEQQVNHFCSDEFHLRSVTFVQLEVAGESDLELLASLKDASEEPKGEESAEAGVGDAAGEGEEEGESEDANELFVSLEPILDPTSGVAMGELLVGDRIACRLPENSVYYRLFMSSVPDFDGSMTGSVTGISVNEFGVAVIGLNLAEGVSGVLKLAGSVRIRRAEGASIRRRLWNGQNLNLPMGFLLGILGLSLLLCLVVALLFSLT